ncbi:MAG: hypothetical protein HY928_11500 [Elusimicrobia bacterium]|nr:hypothetical protein [Elusimicrobiota bacterium]
MGIQKTDKSSFGPAIILAVLLLDVGLMIWGWHLYQRRQERLDDGGLNFARAPEADPSLPVPADPPASAPLSGIDRYVKKEALAPAGPGAPKAGTPAGAKKPALSLAAQPKEAKLKIDRAVSYFFDLKNSPRFKNSKVIQAWKKDFLSHPDLKALNDGWRKDKDPLKFLVGMVQSPSFRGMTEKYLVQADMQAFIKDMATAPAVVNSAGSFMADDSISGAVSGLKLGLGGPAPMKDSSAQMGALKANPALKGFLQGADEAPPVR